MFAIYQESFTKKLSKIFAEWNFSKFLVYSIEKQNPGLKMTVIGPIKFNVQLENVEQYNAIGSCQWHLPCLLCHAIAEFKMYTRIRTIQKNHLKTIDFFQYQSIQTSVFIILSSENWKYWHEKFNFYAKLRYLMHCYQSEISVE